MDPWFIAQCMARLPRHTYFSHSEASLEDFFSGEANANGEGDHQGNSSSSVGERLAPHELQFLTSLGQSLGTPMLYDSTTEPGSSARHDGDAPGELFSASDWRNDRPYMSAEEGAMSQPSESISLHRSVAHRLGSPSSSNELTAMSKLPIVAESTRTQAPVRLPSTAPAHVGSSSDLGGSKSAEPRAVANTSGSSRYQCYWEVAGKPCGEWIEGGSKEVWIHVRKNHGLKGRYSGWCRCHWSGCAERLKVSSLQRHLAKHLDIKWRCSNCHTIFSRSDYVRRHIKLSEECRSASYGTLDPRSEAHEGDVVEEGSGSQNR